MSYIDAIAKGIGTRIRKGRIGRAIELRPPQRDDQRGKNHLPPGTMTAACTKLKHSQCWSLHCACECHGGYKPPMREFRPKTAATRAAISRAVKASWAKRKQQTKEQ